MVPPDHRGDTVVPPRDDGGRAAAAMSRPTLSTAVCPMDPVEVVEETMEPTDVLAGLSEPVENAAGPTEPARGGGSGAERARAGGGALPRRRRSADSPAAPRQPSQRKAVATTFDSEHARSIASRGRGIVSCRSFRGRSVGVGGGGSGSGDERGDLDGVPTAGKAGRSSLGGETSGGAE